MSETDALKLKHSQLAQLESSENALVVVAGELASEVTHRPYVVQGLAAADTSQGLVVSDEAADVYVQGLYQQVVLGQKDVKEQQEKILGIPKRMEKAVRGTLGPLWTKMEDARRRLGKAHVDFIERRQKAAEAERDLYKNNHDEAFKGEADALNKLADERAARVQAERERDRLVELHASVCPEDVGLAEYVAALERIRERDVNAWLAEYRAKVLEEAALCRRFCSPGQLLRP